MGGPEEWLGRAKDILSANGYAIADSLQRADLILVGELDLDALERIPKKFRRKAVVLSPLTIACHLDEMRRAFKMGFYDIVKKPYAEQDLLKTVADAIAEISPRH